MDATRFLFYRLQSYHTTRIVLDVAQVDGALHRAAKEL